VNAKNQEGQTALSIAAGTCKGDAASIRTLIDAKANVNMADKRGLTALVHATIARNAACVKLTSSNFYSVCIRVSCGC